MSQNAVVAFGLMPRYFEIIGRIRNIETIAAGSGIRDLPHLEEHFGPGAWRKLKGVAIVQLADGTIAEAEVIGTRPTASEDAG